jgi:hypothetical protein
MPPTISEIGSTGLSQWGGFIREEYLRELTGRRGMRVYREMGDDDIFGACLFAIEKLALQVDWRVDAFDQTPDNDSDQKRQFLEDALFKDMDQPWSETLAEALTMLQYGFAPQEIVYKRRVTDPEDIGKLVPSSRPFKPSKDLPRIKDVDAPMRRQKPSVFNDGQIGWAKWPIRAQDTIYRWDLDDKTDAILGVIQKTDQKPEVTIPWEKMLLFRASSKRGNPEGRSILRVGYIDWFFKRRLKEIEAIGIERDLGGLPILEVAETAGDLWNPNDPMAADKLAEFKKIVTSVRMDEQGGLVIPFGFKLYPYGSGVGASAGKKIDTNQVITRYDQRMAMTVLADFILIGHEQVGSKALTSTKLTAFAQAMTSFLDHIADVVNRYAVPRLWELNGWPVERMPKLSHGEVEDVDLTALGEYIGKLSGAGVPLFPNPLLEKYLHDVAKLPAPPEGFEERAKLLEEEEKEQQDFERDLLMNPPQPKQQGLPGVAGSARPKKPKLTSSKTK